MPLAVQVVLTDATTEDGQAAFCATAMSMLSPCLARITAPTKQEAIDRIEFQLVCLEVPFILHVSDHCRRTPILVIVEEFEIADRVVATAYFQDGTKVCEGDGEFVDEALTRCLGELPGGTYDLTIQVLDPDDDDSDDDCC